MLRIKGVCQYLVELIVAGARTSRYLGASKPCSIAGVELPFWVLDQSEVLRPDAQM